MGRLAILRHQVGQIVEVARRLPTRGLGDHRGSVWTHTGPVRDRTSFPEMHGFFSSIAEDHAVRCTIGPCFIQDQRRDRTLRLPDDMPKDVILIDLTGRQLQTWSSVTGPILHLPIDELAKGIYWIRVSDGANSKAKRLIVH